MSAKLILHRKTSYDDDAIREMVIWELQTPVFSSQHYYKYSLYYGKAGKRLIGYDNERGKGDHKHIGEDEYPYFFLSLKQLLEDFLQDIKEVRGE